MTQHPKVTVGWAVACLERAMDELGDSGAEARVRRQFHQLMLALERDGHSFLDHSFILAPGSGAKIAPFAPRPQHLS